MIHLAKRSTEMQTCVVQGIFRMLKLFLLLLMLLFPAGKTLASRWDAHFTQTLGAGNTAVREFAVNDANQLTGTTTAQKFPVKLEGTTNEPSDVTVGGENAGTNTQNWTAEVLLGAGTTNVEIRATETTSIAPGTVAQTTVRKAPITLTVAPAQVLTYDGNGSTLGDGLRTYEWDAANRLRAIVTAGSPVKRTEFAYDGENRWVRIVEKEAGTVVGSREVIWEGISIAQLRLKNAAGTETERRTFHAGGEVRVAGAVTTALLHTGDHLGSIRELVDASTGAIRARYDYDPYGKRTKLSGDLEADQGYTGHYEHAASALTLAPFRAYDCVLGRWISRDPIEEAGGLNLYGYVGGNVGNLVDPDGRTPFHVGLAVGIGIGMLADWAYDEFFADPVKDFKEKNFSSEAQAMADSLGNVIDLVRCVKNPARALNKIRKGGCKVAAKSATHKNSLDYVGETHVYRVKGPDGSTYKIGESAQGTRVSDGASIRAEQQARRLTRETGDTYTTEIRKTFPDKASARDYETRVIERFRRMYGDDTLPGNKTNR
jgi:RHS repeat-associated protein